MRALHTVVVLSALAGVAILAACGDDGGATAACDASKCAAGNTCLPLAGVTKCRKTCSSNDKPDTSCPIGYTCTDTQPGAVSPFCVQITATYPTDKALVAVVPKATGQWGTACQANLGLENPACDVGQGFYCFALSKTDGNAYCTSFGCEHDSDCGAGFACQAANIYPNANTSARKAYGAANTQMACVRRSYCSGCVSDVDCPSAAGIAQHCIPDASGRNFCTSECTVNQGCPTDAQCLDANTGTATLRLCFPRARACVGDGSLCQPCLSDADCGVTGVCAKSEFTTERFCAVAAPGGDCKQCPKAAEGLPKRTIGCTNADGDKLPKSYCTGLLTINGAEGADIGCWAPDR